MYLYIHSAARSGSASFSKKIPPANLARSFLRLLRCDARLLRSHTFKYALLFTRIAPRTREKSLTKNKLPGPFANRQRGNGVADDTIRLPGSYSKKTNEYDHMQDNWRIILRHLSAFRIVKEHTRTRYAFAQLQVISYKL